MFITLKAGKNGGAKQARMEQVTLANASVDSRRSHFGAGRRDACVSCRTKKLRCTGDKTTCDRCRSQEIKCVASPASAHRRARKQRLAPSDVVTGPQHDGVAQPVGDLVTTQDEDVPGLPTPPPHTLDSQMQQRIDNDLNNFNATNQDNHFYPTGVTLDETLVDNGGNVVPFTNDLGMTLMDNPFSAAFSQGDDDLPDIGTFDIPEPIPSGITQTMPDSNEVSTSSSPDIATNSSTSTTCTCVEDILDVVQKLDDDEFRLRQLAFDHVLKLQKWLLFHCCKQLDCPNCADKSTGPTMTLIICERIADMFQCLSKRMPTLSAHGIQPAYTGDVHRSHTTVVRGSTEKLGDSTSGRLFDGETGEDGSVVPCNVDMFSSDFRAQYSYEEQLHMIHVLTKIQVRNFNQFLVRFGETPQSQRSRARLGKICYLIKRLQGAATALDDSFHKKLQKQFEYPSGGLQEQGTVI